MKKVLHITKGELGGLDNITKKILNGIPKKYKHHVLHSSLAGKNIYSNFENHKIFSIKLNGEIIYINLFAKIKKLIKSDIIHVHHPKIWLLFSPLCFFSRKIIYTYHNNFGSGIKKNIFIKFLISLIISYTSMFSHKLIFLTNAQKENLKRYSIFKKKLEKKSEVIGNFIDKRTILKEKKQWTNRVLFVGRYTKIKGFENLEEVMRNMPNIKFNLIGDNDYVSPANNIKNLGKKNSKYILKEYDKCDVLILPSYTEAFPMTILEAMSRGLVILVSDITGMSEIIKEGRNGYLFNPGDTQKISEILNFLKNNPKIVKEISKNNLKDIKKFTKENQIKKYREVYREVIKSNDKEKI